MLSAFQTSASILKITEIKDHRILIFERHLFAVKKSHLGTSITMTSKLNNTSLPLPHGTYSSFKCENEVACSARPLRESRLIAHPTVVGTAVIRKMIVWPHIRKFESSLKRSDTFPWHLAKSFSRLAAENSII